MMNRFRFAIISLLLAVTSSLVIWGWHQDTVNSLPLSPEYFPGKINLDSESPSIVKVGLYLLNLGKLETSTGAFTADFYLSFSSDGSTDPGYFEFSNGRATSVDKSVDEPEDKFYRIQAALADNLNLSRYPFDRHNLTIELEDKEHTANSQVYEASMADSGLDPAVNIPGWEIVGWDANVVDHYYKPYDTTFSKYVFNIKIQRTATAAILKTFLPALIIVLMGLLSLVLTPDKIIPRLTLNAGALTGAVLFHLNMTSSLPPLGYLTFGDRFMLINYVALAITLISTLIALAQVDKKQLEKANRVHNIALGVVPAVWIGLQVLNFVLL
jgi:hypothetical protein